MSATGLAIAALVASIVLVLHRRDRLLAIIACCVSGVEVLGVFGIVHLGGGTLVALLLGGALAACGVLLWMRSSGRNPVTAATVLALVGAVQVLAALHFR